MNLLAGDIGGTKTLLGIYTYKDGLKQLYKKKYSSKDWPSFNELLTDFIESLPGNLTLPKYGCIGVAGNLKDRIIKTTNLPWILNEEEIRLSSRLEKLGLVNDFSVLTYGIPFLKDKQYISIQNTKVINYNSNHSNNVFTIIGAGTGLGIARGVITEGGFISLPSEGGHKEFAARTNEEWDLTNWIKEYLSLERVSLERIVSGKGLGYIAIWRLLKSDGKGHPLRKFTIDPSKDELEKLPQLVSSYAQKGDKLMLQALHIWLSAYGSAVGDLALNELCTGGLWIAGGPASKNIDGITSATFKSAMTNKGRFSEFIKELPIFILTDPEIGLFSAACKAHLIASSSVKINSNKK
ncbi:glucokinase [Prochlorococcus marinus]|uniref:glucokinase n=1 Tax=Prochlorococcus marinus TaxID=1219 RepID=UPI0022B2F580|nr:glucokinase [Prochlorococcus marinus]